MNDSPIEVEQAEGNLRAVAHQLYAALADLLGKAYKQNWNDAYPDQVARAEVAIDAFEALK